MDRIQMDATVLKMLLEAVEKARGDVQEIGGGQALRDKKYGVEHHFQWRTMYHLEPLLNNSYFQSPEVKFIPKRRDQYDLGIYKKGIPIIIAEFKVTWYSKLKDETQTEYPKLIDLMQYFAKNNIPLPFFGLVFYQQQKGYQKVDEFMAKKWENELFTANQHLLPHYFEFIVDEKEDRIITFPPTLD